MASLSLRDFSPRPNKDTRVYIITLEIEKKSLKMFDVNQKKDSWYFYDSK